MKILLYALYWFMGFVMAMGAAFALGMAIAAIIALLKITVRPQNILLLGGYLLIGAIAALLTWSGFFIAGWIGDRTEYVGQTGMLVGAIFPGIFSLAIIPQFAIIALKQTSGIEVE
jgi:hypothetical protein